jgi:hypothetical protein
MLLWAHRTFFAVLGVGLKSTVCLECLCVSYFESYAHFHYFSWVCIAKGGRLLVL